MSAKIFGRRFQTAVLSNTTVFQPVKFNTNAVLKACQIWIVFQNSPVFTSLNMKIYSMDGDAPNKLLHTSTNTILKAEVMSKLHGFRGLSFEFDLPVFKGTDKYAFVLQGSGYTGNASSHIGWIKDWPKPASRINVDSSYTKLGVSPYTWRPIWGKL